MANCYLQESVNFIKNTSLNARETNSLLGRLWRFVGNSSSTGSEGKILECVERISRLLAIYDDLNELPEVPELLAKSRVVDVAEEEVCCLHFSRTYT